MPAGAGAEVASLAERVSVLVAGLQQRWDAEREELQRQIEHVDARAEERVHGLQAHLGIFEERLNKALGGAGEAAAPDVLVAKEVHSQIEDVMSKVQARWQVERAELYAEQQEQLQQLEELAGQVHHCAARLEESEEKLQSVLAGRNVAPPNWFGQLEAAVNAVENRLNDQQVTFEVQLGRLSVELDGFRRRSSDDGQGLRGLRDEVVREVSSRLEAELARFEERFAQPGAARGRLREDSLAPVGGLRDLVRRLEDLETKAAAVKVRVDAQEGRLSSVCERAETSSQQALDAARQAAQQQKEEILSEAECQLRMLRQRVDSLSELCEDQLTRQAPRGSQHGSGGTSSMPPRIPR